MPRLEKRRRVTRDEDDEEEEEEVAATQNRRQRRRSTPSEEAEVYGGGDDAEEGRGNTQGDRIEKRARKLVRYALACEFSRQPIRRTDVVKRVLGEEGRDFRAVFAEAQLLLQATFGMVMKEWPAKDKVSVRERRAEAAKTAKQASKTADVWTLTTVLPKEYREAIIIPAPDPVYTSLYTFVIALITLSGGVMQEPKLEHSMRRVNANDYTPLGTTEKLLQRLIKEGYVVKIKDGSSGEELVEYMVGPRGKVEVDKEAIANVIRTIYPIGEEDLEKRIEKSLNIGGGKAKAPAQVNGNGVNGNANGRAEGSGTQRRKSNRRRQRGDDDEEEEEEDNDESDE